MRSRRRAGRGTARVLTAAQVLRHVPGTSPVHRMWAGTKIAVLVALGLTVAAVPTWPVELATLAVLGTGAAAARLPWHWLPRPPRWLVLVTAVPIVVGSLPGGDPYGFGGLLTMLRGTGVALLFLVAALLLAATTRTAELAPALAALMRPARPLRLPVDDVVLVSALAVRSLPLLVDELGTAFAAWRLRVPAHERRRARSWARFVLTAVSAATRRARELAEAMQTRGGPAVPPAEGVRLGLADLVALALAAGVVAVAVVGL